MIIFVGSAFSFVDLWPAKTRKAERKIQKNGDEILGIIKERNIEKTHQVEIVSVSCVKNIEKKLKERNIKDFYEVLIVATANSNIKRKLVGDDTGFYHRTEQGFLVACPRVLERHLNEIISTFFLNRERERKKGGKLYKFKDCFI